ncbi:helix-turn-helix domain-containing protein [Streptomyces sp. NPDC057638]|uniref:helix-turn-helix domain-containing protein n=1 Tax=Streptomyces sp. NPDC057638 TaxID=3346190 RepID=UPI00369753FE
MATVHQWSGLEARALRLALRMSVRVFAEHLGVGIRTVSKWEQLLARTQPRPDTQAILDTALARADAAAHERFETFLDDETGPGTGQGRNGGGRVTVGRASGADLEAWADDLDRTVVALARQDFTFADSLIRRWTHRFPATALDDRGLYLLARATTLLGDLKRDQGSVIGPLSAASDYSTARSLFGQLDIPRRIAQIDLSLAVTVEMAGQLATAARRYENLADDPRLSPRDRARARLWVGTALSKDGNHAHAAGIMTVAARDFEALEEPEDWSVAHQKIALAHRGAGDLTAALACIGIARTTTRPDAPLPQVRLDTAYGHILISDPATRDEGLRVLDTAAHTAARVGLRHQLAAIDTIRAHAEPGRA